MTIHEGGEKARLGLNYRTLDQAPLRGRYTFQGSGQEDWLLLAF